jgi:hypothetical protein
LRSSTRVPTHAAQQSVQEIIIGKQRMLAIGNQQRGFNLRA